MKKVIIITLPRYEDVTEYFSQFSKEIVKEAEKENIKVKSLKDKDANKIQFESFAQSFPNSLLVLNGHGNSKEIFGQDGKTIIEKGINEQLLAKRITYARACESGDSLGKTVTKFGDNGCYIGYKLPFQFYADSTWAGNPLKDNTARTFFEPSNAIPISLINGKSTMSAHEYSKKLMLKNMDNVLKKIDKDSLAIAEALWNNYTGQVLHGNPDAII